MATGAVRLGARPAAGYPGDAPVDAILCPPIVEDLRARAVAPGPVWQHRAESPDSDS